MKKSDKQSASAQYQFLDKLGEGYFYIFDQIFWFHLESATYRDIIRLCMQDGEKLNEEGKITSYAGSEDTINIKREEKQYAQQQGGFPQLISFGSDAQNTYFVMTLLADNLDQVRVRFGNLSISTMNLLATQMIILLKELHTSNIIHRDIKPENFMVLGDKLYLIDFGLSKLYIQDGQHIEFKENKGMIGTARYASINALKGNEQSRRDDMESIGYLLIYLTMGHLPWMNINLEDRQLKYLKILRLKEHYRPETVIGLPQQIIQYLQLVKQLQFTQQPNYEMLLKLFQQDTIPKFNFTHQFVRTKDSRMRTIQLRPVTSRQQSPEHKMNTNRGISFENLSSEGTDLASELQLLEIIKPKQFKIGIKQPMQQVSDTSDNSIEDEFDQFTQQKFVVPLSLTLK